LLLLLLLLLGCCCCCCYCCIGIRIYCVQTLSFVVSLSHRPLYSVMLCFKCVCVWRRMRCQPSASVTLFNPAVTTVASVIHIIRH
jgi:hypothetical protein